MSAKKILFLFYRTPLNERFSTNRRQYFIYSSLDKKYETKILTFGNKNVEIKNQHIIALKNSSLRKIFNFIFKLQSPRITHYKSKEFKEALDKKLKIFQPDFIYVEHLLMMQYLLNIKTSAKIIFFNDESNSFLAENNLRGSIYEKLRNIRLSKMDIEACNKSDFIFTITQEEEVFLKNKGIRNVNSIAYGIDPIYYSFDWKRPSENSILFLGDFSHYPNREAIRILCNKILPLILKHNVRLKIVGRNTLRIKNYISENVSIYENVEDVRKFYCNSSIFVAPLFCGAGLRVKILEAALCGIPLLISNTANLGINFLNNQDAFVCNSWKEMVFQLDNFFNANYKGKLNGMRINARKKIEYKFNENKLENTIFDLFEQISI